VVVGKVYGNKKGCFSSTGIKKVSEQGSEEYFPRVYVNPGLGRESSEIE
jgi:hypothetical protein